MSDDKIKKLVQNALPLEAVKTATLVMDSMGSIKLVNQGFNNIELIGLADVLKETAQRQMYTRKVNDDIIQ